MQVLATALRQEKKIRMIYITKEKSQSIHNADKILNIIDIKDSTRKLLDLINKFSKVTGYKINMQKSVAFLYTNNKYAKKEIVETFPFLNILLKF